MPEFDLVLLVVLTTNTNSGLILAMIFEAVDFVIPLIFSQLSVTHG